MPTKDQERARRAYERVEALWNAYDGLPNDDKARQEKKKDCEDYEIAVKALGANILRSGLSAALADLMRRKDRAKKLREHIAEAQIPGLVGVSEDKLFACVNGLETSSYMLATRETLQVVMWLKRACEALFNFKPETTGAAGATEGDSRAG